MAQASGVSKTDMRRLGELMSAVALALSVTACGGGGGGGSSPSPAPVAAPAVVSATNVNFTGTVVDSSGAAVSGAVVTVNGTSSSGTTTTVTATTGTNGSYTLTATASDVASSNVVVSIAKEGYQTTTLTYSADTTTSTAVSGGTAYTATTADAVSTSTTSSGSVVLATEASVVATDPLVLTVQSLKDKTGTNVAVIHVGDGEASTSGGNVNVFQTALYGPSYTVTLGDPKQLSTYLNVTVAAASLQSKLCANTITVFQATSATGTRLHTMTLPLGSTDAADNAYHDTVVSYHVATAGFTTTDGTLYAQIIPGNCDYGDGSPLVRLDDFEFTNVRAKFSATN